MGVLEQVMKRVGFRDGDESLRYRESSLPPMLDGLRRQHLSSHFAGDHLILKSRLARFRVILNADLAFYEGKGDRFRYGLFTPQAMPADG